MTIKGISYLFKGHSHYAAQVFLIGLGVRFLYHLLGFDDYWGDSYHSVIISKLTVLNDWVYDDYKGREVVWLPAYRYLSAFILYLFDTKELFVIHWMMMLIGSVTCAITSLVIFELRRDVSAAFAGGVILSFLPWHVAFSHMNMSEGFCAFLLTVALLAQIRKQYVLLTIVIMLGVLSRNEMTFIFFVWWVFLLAKKDWGSVKSISTGTAVALLSWMTWCYFKTGDATWWISTRIYGSSMDADFQQIDQRPFWIVFMSLFLAFPPVILFLKLGIRKIVGGQHAVMLLVLMLSHWLFVIIMQFKFFSYPDPHYFLISIPIPCIFFAVVFHEKWKKLRVGMYIAIGSFGLQLPAFYFLPFTNVHATEVGSYIKDNKLSNNVFLNDFPVAWYFGDIPVEKNYSTDQALGFERELIDRKRVASFIDEKEVRYVISQPLVFSHTWRIWPEMNESMPFYWEGYYFKPRFKYEPRFGEEDIMSRFKSRAAAGRGEAILWEVVKKE